MKIEQLQPTTGLAKRLRTLAPSEFYDLLLLISVALGLPLLASSLALPLLLRAPLGLLGVLIAPGYALTAACFPRPQELDGPARAGLSFGLSIATIPLLALVLDKLPWGIRPLPIAISLMLWIVIFGLAALVRRAALPEVEAQAGSAKPPLNRRWALATVGVGLAIIALVATILTSLLSPTPPSLTEFYALGSAGLAESYPRQIAPGEPASLTLGISNREQGPMRYRIRLSEGEQLLRELGPIELASGATWQGATELVMAEAGDDRIIDIALIAEGHAEPYRRLTLWLNVRATPAPTG